MQFFLNDHDLLPNVCLEFQSWQQINYRALRTYVWVKLIVSADDLPLDWGREDEEEDDAEHADRGHHPPSRQPPQPPDPLRDRAGEYNLLVLLGCKFSSN